MEEHKDFLATELLHELKLENERKDRQLGNLHKILVGALCAILMLVGGFIWYLNSKVLLRNLLQVSMQL